MPTSIRTLLILALWIILFVLCLATTFALAGWLLSSNNYTTIFGYESLFGLNIAKLYKIIGHYVKDFEPWHVAMTTSISVIGSVVSLLQVNRNRRELSIEVNNSSNGVVIGNNDGTVYINTSKSENTRARRNHKALRDAVRIFWIDGVLKKSLYNELLIRLDLAQKPDVIERPWNLTFVQDELPEQIIDDDKAIIDVFNEMGQQMLILGEPGSGKTITLLTLIEALIQKAEKDSTHPTPVIFNLSSWASSELEFEEWLVEELTQRYHMPEKVAHGWIANDELMLMLDGLDEVTKNKRDACVDAINRFKQEHVVSIALCSRIEEYTALGTQLKLNGAIVIRPLTDQQIDDYIITMEPHLNGLGQALSIQPEFRSLARNPLMLNIMTLTFHDQPEYYLQANNFERTYVQDLFDHYIRRMFEHRNIPNWYIPSKTMYWLRWLAQRLVERSQTTFYIENLQPDWLERPPEPNANRFSESIRTPYVVERLRMLYKHRAFSLWIFLPVGLWNLANIFYFRIVASNLSLDIPLIVFFIGAVATSWILYRDWGENRKIDALPLIIGTILIPGFRQLNIIFSEYHWTTGPIVMILSIWGLMALPSMLNFMMNIPNSILNILKFILNFRLTLKYMGRRRFRRSHINIREVLNFSWRNGIIIGPIIGVCIGLPAGFLASGFFEVNIYVLACFLSSQIIFVIAGLNEWKTWQELRQEWDPKLTIALNFGAIGAFCAGIIASLVLSPEIGAAVGIIAFIPAILMAWSIAMISGASRSAEAEAKIVPNQGIWQSFRNGSGFGLAIGCLTATGVSLSFGFVVGVAIGLITLVIAGVITGLQTCVHHLLLRIQLYLDKCTPKNYAHFLNYAAERLFLRKIGGGYIFVHRMILEHFATLTDDDIHRITSV